LCVTPSFQSKVGPDFQRNAESGLRSLSRNRAQDHDGKAGFATEIAASAISEEAQLVGEAVTTGRDDPALPGQRSPDGDPAQHARLETIARGALRTYGIGPDATLTLLNVSENATYAVDDHATGERSVLRVHRPGYHTQTAIESELAWVAALREEQVVAPPAVLPSLRGELVTVGTHPDGERRHAVRFAWVPGQEPAGGRLVDDFRALGSITARLHEHARRWRRPAWFTRFAWGYDESIGPRGHWGRWQDGMSVGAEEHAILARLDHALQRRLAAFGDGPDRFGLVHADMRLANLLVDPHRETGVTVIDFDDSGFGWYLYDLGSSLSFIEDDPRVPELVDAWVDGYREVGQLSAEEVAELPTFVLLRRLLLVAWIGSHADTQLAQSMGAEYTRGSCELAEQYLSRFA
jgi:Ser/Thr protein kinase RdoA (MazF antagonist)